MNDDEKMYREWLWFCSIPGMTRMQQAALLSYFGSPREVMEAAQSEIDAWMRRGIQWMKNVENYRRHAQEMIEKNERYMIGRGIRFLTRDSAQFPEKLRLIADCPYGIFIMGKLPDPAKRSVAIVGARACSSYGLHFASKMGEALASYDVQVISGMACGVDGAAQRSALEARGYSCGVLGCGVDICYPMDNASLYQSLKERGCVISEYPCQSPPMPFHFPQRNRIISALSDIVVVIEARKKSGSLITADMALEQGKDVYAVPGRAGDALSTGCNTLIRQGAGIVVSVEDFLVECGLKEEMKTRKEERYPSGLDQNERIVLDCLESDVLSLQEIAMRCGLSTADTAAALLQLQLLGRASEVGKNYYVGELSY